MTAIARARPVTADAVTQSELEAWGERIGAMIEPPAFLALRGELGAGKSVLARAIARGAGVTSPMPSPTFNLLFRYPSQRGIDIVHLDLYRLERQDDVWELGWNELGDGNEIVIVEWPERAESLLHLDRWDIELAIRDPDTRVVTATPSGTVPSIPEIRAI